MVRVKRFEWAALCVGFVFIATSVTATDWSAVKRLADNDLVAVADRLEVVRVSGQLSHLEYYASQAEPSNSRLQLPERSLPIIGAKPYGSLKALGGGRFQKGKGAGGLILQLASRADVVNLLPYHELTLHGTWQGDWQLSVADDRLAQRQDNHVLRPLTRSAGSQRFSLQQLPVSFDRARCRYFVLRLKSAAGSLELQGITLQRSLVSAQRAGRAAWLWDVRQVIGHEAVVLEKLQRHAITRLYLQVDDYLPRYAPFLRLARAAGVAVYALDGAPDGHMQSSSMLKRIASVAAFNREHPHLAFSGFQLDVEPYLQKDFSLNKARHIAAYLALFDEARRQAGPGLPLSAAIPFWFAQVATAGRDLAQEVLQRVDEVVVMAYRRDYDEVVQISTPILAAAEWVDKPVWLGIELTPLADEEHLVLRAAAEGEKSDLELAGRRWRVINSYQVKGDTLSLAGAPELLSALLRQRPPFTSFNGWVLHSLEVLERTQ
ncbi:MAG: hypothetical protein RBQ93_00735 [Trichlorobacter sp.]|nr:hypothetical protein [Trichlorobacter sp.]